MINLLPPVQQRELRRDKTFKMATTLGLVVVSSLFVFALALLTVESNYESRLELKIIEVREREEKLAMLDVAKEEQKISDYNELFAKIDKFYARQTGISRMFDALVSGLPQGIALSECNVAGEKISLTGLASDRETLGTLKSNLEGAADFNNVFFPPSVWMESKDIFFTVTFDYGPKK